MHITLETDYAIRILNVLARKKLEMKNSVSGEKRRFYVDAKTISEKTDVPLGFALKILHKLVNADIVRSYKGVYGGYEFARELDELSLYDVVELVEGIYKFSRCLGDGYNCVCEETGLPCAYRHVFSELSDKVNDFLKKQTFDKLVK